MCGKCIIDLIQSLGHQNWETCTVLLPESGIDTRQLPGCGALLLARQTCYENICAISTSNGTGIINVHGVLNNLLFRLALVTWSITGK